MDKRKVIPGAVIGAAVIGAVAYALFNKKSGKKMRTELQDFISDVMKKGSAVGKVTRSAYEDAVDSAAKMYRDSKDLTSTQREQLKSLVEDLKDHWVEAEKAMKKAVNKKGWK